MEPFLQRLFSEHLAHVLRQEPVPDDEEEMNWRLFFAHSQDMQGFAADIFTGGPNEREHPNDPSFQGLRLTWGKDSKSLIGDLAACWLDTALRERMKTLTRADGRRRTIEDGLQILEDSRVQGACVFAETLRRLSGDKVARKTNRMIRAYIQNASLLQRHDCSFRRYLQDLGASEVFRVLPVGLYEPEGASVVPSVSPQFHGGLPYEAQGLAGACGAD